MARRRTQRKRKPAQHMSKGSVGYCVKCREKRPMQNCRTVKTRRNRNMLKGTCPKCGTKMNKFI